MDFTLTPISQLDKAGFARLASLHSLVMHTLLSDLGTPIILHYYETVQTDPLALGFCAISPTGELIGWAIGSQDPARLNTRLRQPFTWFAVQMIRLLFTRPLVFLELARSVFSANQANKLKNGQIELTYIGISHAVQRQGLGKALLAAFIEQAAKSGYTSIVLSVETDNASAVSLYTKSGFQIQQTFSEGRFTRHRMEFSIT